MLISAGGTGGHIMPALAVALELRRKTKWNLHWLGGGGMEYKIVAANNIDFSYVHISAFRGKGLPRKLIYPLIFARALIHTFILFRRINPDAIFTTGGYVSVPAAVVAFMLRKPIFLQEQNTNMGWANRLVSLIAAKIYLGFMPDGNVNRDLGDKTILCGNPSALDSIKLPHPGKRYTERKGAIRIFITGGSQGAQVFNQVIPAALGKGMRDTFHIRHQAGVNKVRETEDAYRIHKIKNYKVMGFTDNIREFYEWADIVIARAGALTLTDLTLVGVAAILVPFPYAADKHQLKNSLALGNYVIVIEQKNFTAAKLRSLLLGWAHSRETIKIREDLAKQATELRKLARPGASANIVESLVGSLEARYAA